MKLPDLTEGQRATPTPAGGVASYQPEDLGAAMAPGQAVSELGNTVQNEMDRIGTLQAEDAYTKLRNWQLDQTVGPQGFQSLKGAAAVNGPQLPAITQSFNDTAKEIGGNLFGVAATKFKARADIAGNQFKEDFLRHQVQQSALWSNEVTNTSIDSEIRSIAANYGDDNAIGQSMARINGLIDAHGRDPHVGLSAGAIDNLKIAALQKATAARLEAWSEVDPVAAYAHFKQNQMEIQDTEVRRITGHRLREASMVVDTANTADQMVADALARLPEQKAKMSAGQLDQAALNLFNQSQKKGLAVNADFDGEIPDNASVVLSDASKGKAFKVSVDTSQPTPIDLNSMPNARDVRAQLPALLGKVDAEATKRYGEVTNNPDRVEYVNKLTAALQARVARETTQLTAVQRENQGDLIDFITGLRTGQKVTDLSQVTGGAAGGDGSGGLMPVTSMDQIYGNPTMRNKWQMIDPQARVQLENLIHTNSIRSPGDDALFWDVYGKVHAPDGSPGKIDFPQQLIAYAGPGKLSVEQIARLRSEMSFASTFGGKSANTSIQWAASQANSFFARTYALMANPDAQNAAKTKFALTMSDKLDEYVKAGKDWHSLFRDDTPDSIVSTKYLQTLAGGVTQGMTLSNAAGKVIASGHEKGQTYMLRVTPNSAAVPMTLVGDDPGKRESWQPATSGKVAIEQQAQAQGSPQLVGGQPEVQTPPAVTTSPASPAAPVAPSAPALPDKPELMPTAEEQIGKTIAGAASAVADRWKEAYKGLDEYLDGRSPLVAVVGDTATALAKGWDANKLRVAESAADDFRTLYAKKKFTTDDYYLINTALRGGRLNPFETQEATDMLKQIKKAQSPIQRAREPDA